ncbi:DUF5958 family protein [Streptomyces sp. Act-28]
MIERDVLLNELAQALRPISEGIEWFDGLGQKEQSEVLLFLRHHCVQSRAVAEEKWQKKLTDADRRALSPLFWTHVNPCGRFEPDMNPHLDLATAMTASVPGPRSSEPATAPA